MVLRPWQAAPVAEQAIRTHVASNSSGVRGMDERMADAPVGQRIDIVSDAICPWCFIGKRQLERALVTLAGDGLNFSIHWNPFQLNPDMAKEGVERASYRAWKFGGAEKAKAIDARMVEAASQVGLE